MKVRISGPNLRDQSKGNFHVHREGCADIKKAAKSDPAFSKRESMITDVASLQDAAEYVYSDQIAEHEQAVRAHEDGTYPLDAEALKTAEEWSKPTAYLSDFHFAPCTAELPISTPLQESETAMQSGMSPEEFAEANEDEPTNTNQQEITMATRTQRSSRKSNKTTEPVQTVVVPEDQTPAFVISPDALDKVEQATNGTVTAEALASAIKDAPDVEIGDPTTGLIEPSNESSPDGSPVLESADESADESAKDDDDNGDHNGGEAEVKADNPPVEVAQETPRRTVNRGTYTDEQKARSRWITEKYARTGPDVVKAIELATLAVLEVDELTQSVLETAFADPAVCEAIRKDAAESCHYVTKTNVPRALEAHIAQLEDAAK